MTPKGLPSLTCKKLGLSHIEPGKTELREMRPSHPLGGARCRRQDRRSRAFLCQPRVPHLVSSPIPALISFPIISSNFEGPHILRSPYLHGINPLPTPPQYSNHPRVPNTHEAEFPNTSPPPCSQRGCAGGRQGQVCSKALRPQRTKGRSTQPAVHPVICVVLTLGALGTLSCAMEHTACFPAVWRVRTPPAKGRGLWALSECREEK